MGLREDKKRELHERIRDTTLALFGRQGFGSTRVADIAAQLRISEATFFNYFPTKQAVLHEALRTAVDAAAARVRDAQTDPGLDALRDFAAELVTELSPDRPVGQLLARHPELIGVPGVAELQPPSLIALCADLQTRGAMRTELPADVLGAALLAVLWVAARAAFGDSSDALADALQRGVDLVIGGLAPAPSGEPRPAGRKHGAATAPSGG